MPATYTDRNRLEMPVPGDSEDTWGDDLNGNMITMTDLSLDGVAAFALSGSKTLTTANAADDEARRRTLNVTSGTGGTVTIPNLEKWYLVRNNSSADVTFTTGSGTSTAVKSGAIVPIFCDGANAVYQAIRPDFGSANISTTGTLASGAQTITGTITASDALGITKNANADLNGVVVSNTTNGASSAARLRANSNVAQIVMTAWASSVATYGGKNTIEGTGNIIIRPSGTAAVEVDNLNGLYLTLHATTASAANAFIDTGTSNALKRSTSSEWYKTGIEDVEQKYLDAALSIRAVYYRPHPEQAPNDNPNHGYWGHIAEEVAAIDPRLVHWGYQERDFETYTFELPVAVETGELDDDGNPIVETVMEPQEGKRLKEGAVLRPDGAQYERINVLKIEALRRQNVAQAEQIAALQAAVAALQAA